jgi:acetaldehyde dehydrogenase (acetylating)
MDRDVAEEVYREFREQGGYVMNDAEMDALAKALVTPQRLPNPQLVGKSALFIAHQVGLTVPDGTRVLLAPLKGVGRDFPLSIEKLCPVLSLYVVSDWREGCERCIEILRYGGMGHTMSIHSKNEEVILQFGLRKPAFRICVNTPTTHGSIGLTTGLDPAMTLGCGGWGGNITSDNISPRHLLNVKRLAYEVRPAVVASKTREAHAPMTPETAVPSASQLLRAPVRTAPAGLSAQLLSSKIDQFLASRGYRPPDASSSDARSVETAMADGGKNGPAKPLTFVCEEDVRVAVRAGQKLVIDEKTIVTPSARDLGESVRIFVHTG